MTSYKKMLIEKAKIMPLIEILAQAYNNADGNIVVIEAEKNMFLLFDNEGGKE